MKSAAGGLPQSLTSTLRALANLPGGGIIILGLDERSGFRPVALEKPQDLKQGLALKARAFTPPVQLTISDGTVDDHPVTAWSNRSAAEAAPPATDAPRNSHRRDLRRPSPATDCQPPYRLMSIREFKKPHHP